MRVFTGYSLSGENYRAVDASMRLLVESNMEHYSLRKTCQNMKEAEVTLQTIYSTTVNHVIQVKGNHFHFIT